MNDLIPTYEYHLAWGAYLLAGLAITLIWWQLVRKIGSQIFRELLLGLALVAIFTPWFASEQQAHLAPALMVVGMELLLGGTAESARNGILGIAALLAATLAMLTCLIIRHWRRRRRNL